MSFHLLNFAQNIQTNGQYLKFDNMYTSAKAFACLSLRKLRIQKKAFILLFTLQQIFSI